MREPRGQAQVDVDHALEHRERLEAWPLERVSADDRAKTTAISDGPHIGEKIVGATGRAARKDNDPASGKGSLDDLRYPNAELRQIDPVVR